MYNVHTCRKASRDIYDVYEALDNEETFKSLFRADVLSENGCKWYENISEEKTIALKNSLSQPPRLSRANVCESIPKSDKSAYRRGGPFGCLHYIQTSAQRTVDNVR